MRFAQHGTLSIIVPVLNEGALIDQCLESLQALRAHGHELIVIDGGSRDNTVEKIAGRADVVLHTSTGRSTQMNRGAAVARGNVLWFLHVDSRVPAGADKLITNGLESSGRQWGRFDVQLSGNTVLLRCVAFFMNLRSRLTGVTTGDQGIFVTRDAFTRIGGFPPVELMEDIRISCMLKQISAPLCLRKNIVASSRRWERDGLLRTVLLMWMLRLGHALGVSPSCLARIYQRSAT